MFVILGFLAHMGLAFLMKQSSVISAGHALLTVILGLIWIALSPRKKNERTLYLCAYIAGSEILWRMTKSPLFWEYGKYAVILVLLFTSSRALFSKKLPWLYFLCLVPSMLFVLDKSLVDFVTWRKDVSQNISGPISLMVCYACLSSFKVSGDQLRKTFLALLLPLAGVVFLCTSKLYSLGESVTFNTESNFAASGGFGPNQVSAMMGLGALLVFLYCINPGRKRLLRNWLILFGVWFAAQSALTFSRAGLLYAVISVVIAGLFSLKNAKARNRFIVFLIGAFLIGNYVVLPRLDKYTEGKLSQRFSERTTSNRASIMNDEVEIFKSHPILGVGIGQAKYNRSSLNSHALVASHTEFTRLLAEHGLFGVFAILLMFCMGLMAFMKAKTNMGKALAASFVTWTFCFMIGNGMRLVAPSLIFGLSSINLLPQDFFTQKNSSEPSPLNENDADKNNFKKA